MDAIKDHCLTFLLAIFIILHLPILFIRASASHERLFDPVATLHLFILQILNFNTAITHLRHLAKVPINAASYCKARMRLPLAVAQRLLESSAQAMAGGKGARRLWHGLRVYLTDGSGTIAPDTPELQKLFPHPGARRKAAVSPR